jgi:hypothetical protein
MVSPHCALESLLPLLSLPVPSWEGPSSTRTPVIEGTPGSGSGGGGGSLPGSVEVTPVIWPDFSPNLRSQRPVTSTDISFPPTSPVKRTIDSAGPLMCSASSSSLKPALSSSIRSASGTVTDQEALRFKVGSEDQ